MPLVTLPEGFPQNGGEAFHLITQKDSLDINDLHVLALVEASGRASYAAIADTSDNEEIKTLLNKNGREEVGHAHRVMKVLTLLTGEEFQLPEDRDNPLVNRGQVPAISAELLKMFVQAEYEGEIHYNRWADNALNDEVAKIFRLIGADEVRHASRLEQALELL